MLAIDFKREGLARPERFELPTYSSGGCRSIQLSYGRVVSVYIAVGAGLNGCSRSRRCSGQGCRWLGGQECPLHTMLQQPSTFQKCSD
jgi:hypothetical protein